MKRKFLVIPLVAALVIGSAAVGVSAVSYSQDKTKNIQETVEKEKPVVEAAADEASIQKTTPIVNDPVIKALMEEVEAEDEELEYKLYQDIIKNGDYDQEGIDEATETLYNKRMERAEQNPEMNYNLPDKEHLKKWIVKGRISIAISEKIGEYKRNYLLNLIKESGYCDKDLKAEDLIDEDKKVDFFTACCKTYKDEKLNLDDTDKARIAKFLNDCYYSMHMYGNYNEKLQSAHDMIESTVPLQYGKRDLKSLWEQNEATQSQFK